MVRVTNYPALRQESAGKDARSGVGVNVHGITKAKNWGVKDSANITEAFGCWQGENGQRGEEIYAEGH